MKHTAQLSCLFILILGLAACDNSQQTTNEQRNTNKFDAVAVNDKNNERQSAQAEQQQVFSDILYNPLTQQLVNYNAISGQYSLWDSTDSQIQYQVPNTDDLYIDGNSISSGFKLIQLKDNHIETVYEFAENEGAFPIALLDNKLYFIHTFYQPDGAEIDTNRSIAIYDLDTKQVVEFKEDLGMVTEGRANSQAIYYTVYDNDKGGYELRKLALTNPSDSNGTDNQPELLQSNLRYRAVNMLGSQVCTTDNSDEYIICGDKKWLSLAVDMFKGSKLIQIYYNDNLGLSLQVTDTTSNQVEFDISDVVGIKFDGDTLIVGTSSGIKKYQL